MSVLGFKKEVCEGHLGGVSMLSRGKLLPSDRQGIFKLVLVLAFCPPTRGVLSAVKFLTPSELLG